LLPVSIASERNAVRFAQNVSPKFWKMHRDLTPRDANGRPKFDSVKHLTDQYKELLSGLNDLTRKHNCPVWKTFASPFIQLPFFITLSLALRKLVVEGKYQQELMTGGHLWFTDLTTVACDEFLKFNTADPSALLLPLSATSLALLNVQLAFGDRFPLLKKVLQLMPIVFLPVTYQLPACLFVYWVSSFALTTTHILVRRQPWYRANVALDPTFQRLGAAPDVEVKEPMKPEEGEEAGGRLDLKAMLEQAEEKYKDDPVRLKGEQIQILIKRMTYEREQLLPKLVQEVSSGRIVDEELCRDIEDKIQEERRAGRILAMPPVKVLKEAVTVDATPAEEGGATAREERRFRIRVSFLTPDGSEDIADLGGGNSTS